jgi:hypothetical protein
MQGLRGERGASAVEFALVLPMMLLLFFAILEYGWYMVNQAVLTGAVSAGARAGIKANEWDENNPQDPREEARRAVREAFWPFPIEEQQIVADDEYYLTEGGPRMLNVSVSGLAYQSLTGYLPANLLPGNLSAKALAVFP